MLHAHQGWPSARLNSSHRHWCRDVEMDAWENEGGALRGRPLANGGSMAGGDRWPAVNFALFDDLPVGVLVTSAEGEVCYSNRAVERLLAASGSQLLGRHWLQMVDVRDRAACPVACEEVKSAVSPRFFEVRLITGVGRRVWVRYCIARLGPDRGHSRYVHSIEDIRLSKAAQQLGVATQEQLSQAGESARAALERVDDAVISTDVRGRISYMNPVAETLTGWSRQGALGKPFRQVYRLIDSNTGQSDDEIGSHCMHGCEILQLDANGLLLRPDGSELAIEQSVSPIRNLVDQHLGVAVVFRDRRLSAESTTRMARLARNDELTGLSNRLAFKEHFQQALNLARRHGNRVALLFIDLDNFKKINDTLGHGAGDHVLKALARKLNACVRSTDLVCRYGGDEFVVLLSEMRQQDDAGKVAALIHKAAGKAISYRGHVICLELSIGISLFPEHGEKAKELLFRADAAMYRAKLEGGGQCCLYQLGMEGQPSAVRLGKGLARLT